MDYFEFVPSDALEVDETTAKAKVCYDEVVSGTPFLALYKGEQLVVAEEFDAVENQRIVEISVPYAEEFDAAKMFIWNNKEEMIPITKAVVFGN